VVALMNASVELKNTFVKAGIAFAEPMSATVKQGIARNRDLRPVERARDFDGGA